MLALVPAILGGTGADEVLGDGLRPSTVHFALAYHERTSWAYASQGGTMAWHRDYAARHASAQPAPTPASPARSRFAADVCPSPPLNSATSPLRTSPPSTVSTLVPRRALAEFDAVAVECAPAHGLPARALPAEVPAAPREHAVAPPPVPAAPTTRQFDELS